MHKIILQYYIFPEKKKTFLQAINVWVMEYSSLSSDLDKNLILFLTLCVGLCGPFTGGESWVNFSLSFCSPFSLSFTYSPQEWKNKTKHNAALCLIVCHHICLSREFFFSCLTVANSGPILLFCSLIQVTWSQWKQKHRPKDFRGSVWMLFTSVNSVWKLVSVEELKVTLAQVASEQLCLHVSFFFALGLMGLGSVSLSLILYCLVLITTRQSSVSQITCCLTVYLSSKAILECDG